MNKLEIIEDGVPKLGLIDIITKQNYEIQIRYS